MPPVKADFPTSDGGLGTALQTLSTIGQIQQGRASIELRKDELNFNREQAVIQNNIDERKLASAAKQSAIKMQENLVRLMTDNTLPIQTQIGAIQAYYKFTQGKDIVISEGDFRTASSKGGAAMKLAQTLGYEHPTTQAAIEDFSSQYAGTPEGAGLLNNLHDFGRMSFIHMDNPTPEGLTPFMHMNNDPIYAISNLNQLEAAKAHLEAFGRHVPPWMNQNIEALQAHLNINETRMSEPEQKESAQIRHGGEKQRRIVESSEMSINLSNMVIESTEMVEMAESQANFQRALTLDPASVVGNSLANFDTGSGALTAIVKQADRKRDETEYRVMQGYGAHLRQNPEALQEYRSIVNDMLPEMLSNAKRHRAELVDQGESTELVDAQLEQLERATQLNRNIVMLAELPPPGSRDPNEQPGDRLRYKGLMDKTLNLAADMEAAVPTLKGIRDRAWDEIDGLRGKRVDLMERVRERRLLQGMSPDDINKSREAIETEHSNKIARYANSLGYKTTDADFGTKIADLANVLNADSYVPDQVQKAMVASPTQKDKVDLAAAQQRGVSGIINLALKSIGSADITISGTNSIVFGADVDAKQLAAEVKRLVDSHTAAGIMTDEVAQALRSMVTKWEGGDTTEVPLGPAATPALTPAQAQIQEELKAQLRGTSPATGPPSANPKQAVGPATPPPPLTAPRPPTAAPGPVPVPSPSTSGLRGQTSARIESLMRTSEIPPSLHANIRDTIADGGVEYRQLARIYGEDAVLDAIEKTLGRPEWKTGDIWDMLREILQFSVFPVGGK